MKTKIKSYGNVNPLSGFEQPQDEQLVKSPIESAILGLRNIGMPFMADSIQIEYAALVEVAEAGKEYGMKTCVLEMSPFQKEAQSKLAQACANLAAVREGGTK